MRFAHYDWDGGREALLRLGPDTGPTILFAPALFEEANRLRAAMLDVARRLAAEGLATAIPDLPGQNESVVPTEKARLTSWRRAFATCAAALPGPVHLAGWRGGALVDVEADAASRWYLAPLSGAAMVRELHRIRSAAGLPAAAGAISEYGGNLVHRELLAELDGAEPTIAGPVRTVRLVTDPRSADAKLAGPALWRRAEPTTDAALQAALAADLARWITTCAG